jgi:hypothetical protein
VSRAILSCRYPQLADALRRRGCKTVPAETVESFIPYERDHADLQCLIIDDTAFVLRCCERLGKALSARYTVVLCGEGIRGDYPHNVALSAKIVGKNLIARLDTLDPRIREYAVSRGYRLINVRQGYAACAIAAVSDNAVITSDRGVIKELAKTGMQILRIGEGSIRLGADCSGFIGGASGLVTEGGRRTLYFAGNIAAHPDFFNIEHFCEQQGTAVESLTEDELTDIGGIIQF